MLMCIILKVLCYNVKTYFNTVLAPTSVIVSIPALPFSEGNSTSLTCTIMLVNDLTNGSFLEVNWILPDNFVTMAGGSSDATLTGSGTSYESVLTLPTLSLSLAGSYICSAMIISTSPLTTNSEAVMNSAIVTVQGKENKNSLLEILIACTCSCFS